MAIFRGLLTAGNKNKHSAGLQDIPQAGQAGVQRSGGGGLMNYVGAADAALDQLSPGYRRASGLVEGGAQMAGGEFNQGFNTMTGGLLDNLDRLYTGGQQMFGGDFSQGLNTIAGTNFGGQAPGAIGGGLNMGPGVSNLQNSVQGAMGGTFNPIVNPSGTTPGVFSGMANMGAGAATGAGAAGGAATGATTAAESGGLLDQLLALFL